MDIKIILEAITQHGFPICLSLIVIYFVGQLVKALTDYMATEQRDMRAAIEDLRVCITSLTEKINDILGGK